AIVEERAAQQVAAEAHPGVVRVALEEQRELLPRLGKEARVPQAEAVSVFVVAGIVGRRLGDRLHRRDARRARGGGGRSGSGSLASWNRDCPDRLSSGLRRRPGAGQRLVEPGLELGQLVAILL